MSEKERQAEHRISDLEAQVRRLTERLDRIDPEHAEEKKGGWAYGA